MTFLKEIYSEPEGLFDKVKFKKGINIIYGKQVKDGDEKPSLNSIGKSTLISLIDFCLLSKFDKSHKLFKAKGMLDPYKIVLKLEIKGVNYIVKRSTSDQGNVIFSKEGEKEEEFNIEDLRRILYKKMFSNADYKGISKDMWFRSLIPLFIRDEKTGFENPIEYIKEVNRLKSTIFHLMLMDIDNTLSEKNCSYVQEIKKKDDEITGVTNIIKEQYGDIESINNKLDNLKKEIDLAEESKSKFKLNDSYKLEEEQANKLTLEIKELILRNNHLRDMLSGYRESYNLSIDIDPKKITRVYEELNKDLGIILKKTLDQTIEFKNKLIDSRKNFIKDKIIELEETINKNTESIRDKDLERSKIFSFLENKKAIADLSGLFDIISQKTKEYDDLKGKISLLEDMNKSYLRKKTEYSQLLEQINEFLKSIKSQISSIREIYNEVYKNLYTSSEKEGFFDIVFDKGKDVKMYIIASSQDGDGYGKNRGCILVYDLSLLFNIVNKKLPYPKFWIHDGVFNGIYKNQFVSTMNLLNKKSATMDFQYITTLNEDEEVIDDKRFGKLEFDLKDMVIATYTNKATGKIFKKEY